MWHKSTLSKNHFQSSIGGITHPSTDQMSGDDTSIDTSGRQTAWVEPLFYLDVLDSGFYQQVGFVHQVGRIWHPGLKQASHGPARWRGCYQAPANQWIQLSCFMPPWIWKLDIWLYCFYHRHNPRCSQPEVPRLGQFADSCPPNRAAVLYQIFWARNQEQRDWLDLYNERTVPNWRCHWSSYFAMGCRQMGA